MDNIKYKSNSDRNKTLSVEEYIKKIRPYLKDINNLKKSDTWKIQLKIANNFNIKLIWNRYQIVSFSLIMFIYCIASVKKINPNCRGSYPAGRLGNGDFP